MDRGYALLHVGAAGRPFFEGLAKGWSVALPMSVAEGTAVVAFLNYMPGDCAILIANDAVVTRLRKPLLAERYRSVGRSRNHHRPTSAVNIPRLSNYFLGAARNNRSHRHASSRLHNSSASAAVDFRFAPPRILPHLVLGRRGAALRAVRALRARMARVTWEEEEGVEREGVVAHCDLRSRKLWSGLHRACRPSLPLRSH